MANVNNVSVRDGQDVIIRISVEREGQLEEAQARNRANDCNERTRRHLQARQNRRVNRSRIPFTPQERRLCLIGVNTIGLGQPRRRGQKFLPLVASSDGP
jgi:hypothetical protein